MNLRLASEDCFSFSALVALGPVLRRIVARRGLATAQDRRNNRDTKRERDRPFQDHLPFPFCIPAERLAKAARRSAQKSQARAQKPESDLPDTPPGSWRDRFQLQRVCQPEEV
jgi:hypothetical protein